MVAQGVHVVGVHHPFGAEHGHSVGHVLYLAEHALPAAGSRILLGTTSLPGSSPGGHLAHSELDIPSRGSQLTLRKRAIIT